MIEIKLNNWDEKDLQCKVVEEITEKVIQREFKLYGDIPKEGCPHNVSVEKALKFMSELGELKLYPYQYEMINLLSEFNTENSLQELSELATDPDDFSSDIPSLKKRIKYCKNPLEQKSLERQLNAAYKETKNGG